MYDLRSWFRAEGFLADRDYEEIHAFATSTLTPAEAVLMPFARDESAASSRPLLHCSITRRWPIEINEALRPIRSGHSYGYLNDLPRANLLRKRCAIRNDEIPFISQKDKSAANSRQPYRRA